MNLVLDRLYFKANSQSVRTILKPDNTTKSKQADKQTNKQMMLKADNYNEYNYNQASGEKHMGRRQYTIRSPSMRSRSEV